MIKWLVLAFFALATLFGGYLYYGYSEGQSYKFQRASCELGEVSKRLNRYYKVNKEYPEQSFWVEAISEGLHAINCGKPLNMTSDSVLDPWNNKYIYEEVGVGRARILSTRSALPVFNLYQGTLLPVGIQ